MADEVVEAPDQEEDPEGYVEHVQKIREEEAERAEQEDAIARERSGRPTAEQEAEDAEKIAKAEEKAAEKDAS